MRTGGLHAMLIQQRKFSAFTRLLVSLRGALAACVLLPLAAVSAPLQDSMAQRVLACTGCHGAQGRAAPDGYYPRIAGKPAGYLYNQLVNFRQGRRQYHLMTQLLDPLSDSYVQEIALHFASLELPYPPPGATQATAQELRRGAQLVRQGDKAQGIPACDQCHGKALTGTLPGVPGLLGLPRDYLNAQLGAWQVGRRQAHAPDCMATVARRMQVADVAAVSAWLASQPLPAKPQAVAAGPTALPLDCGSARQTPPEASAAAASASTAQIPILVERGRYLAVLGNCQACHTRRGGAPYEGGRGIPTPFGTVFSSNLTPSPAGLGAWSADDFWRALHLGQSRDGHVLYPAFPYTNTTHMTRPDSDALFAYLRTMAPQADQVPAHQLRWPFNTQAALHVWRALYFREGSTTQPLPRGDTWCRRWHTAAPATRRATPWAPVSRGRRWQEV